MSERAQIRAAERFEHDKAKMEQNAVRHLMQSTAGRSWVYDLLEEWGAFSNSFTQGDPYRTSFNCGLHEAALQLLNAITQHAPEHYAQMLEERKALNERVRNNDNGRNERSDDLGVYRDPSY